MGRHRIDLVAVTASVLALALLVAYVAIMRQEEDEPVAWVLVALAIGAAGAAYGAVTSAPYGRVALVLAAVVLGGLGLLAILSIGLPILVAGGLCLLAVVRRSPDGAG